MLALMICVCLFASSGQGLLGCRSAAAAETEAVKAEEVRVILTTEKALAFAFGGLTQKEVVDDILQRLNELDIKATFFVTDQEMRRYPDTIRKIIQNGHEMGVALRSQTSDTADGARKELVDLRNLLQKQFGVTTNLVRQASGAVSDTTRAAIAAENCVLVGQSYNIVQSKHKDYNSAEEVMPELFGKFVYSLMRGHIVYFRLDFYTNKNLAGEVMEAVKRVKIDNIAFSTVYDNPVINPANDTQMKIKPVGAILNNTQYRYTLPVDKEKVPYNLRSDVHAVTVNDANFLSVARKRYLGTHTVTEDDRVLGFARTAIRRLDKSGTVHTNDNVVFLSFDDWGSEAAISKLLYVLKKHNATATFFVITRTVPTSTNLLRQIALDGHEIASHSDQHKPMVVRDPKSGRQMPTQTKEEYLADLALSYQRLQDVTGDVIVNGKSPLTRLFRPPTLAISKMGFEALFETGYEWIVSGSYSSQDYVAPSVKELVNRLKYGIYDRRGRLQKGATIVMHMSDTSKYTPIAVDIMLSINDKKADSDPTKFKTGRLSDYLTEDYDQSKPFKKNK